MVSLCCREGYNVTNYVVAVYLQVDQLFCNAFICLLNIEIGQVQIRQAVLITLNILGSRERVGAQ